MLSHMYIVNICLTVVLNSRENNLFDSNWTKELCVSIAWQYYKCDWGGMINSRVHVVSFLSNAA